MQADLTDVQKWQRALQSPAGPHATIRHILLTLSVRMKRDGDNAWPGLRELESRTGLTQRTLITRLDEADEKKWVRRLEHRGGRGGKYRQYLPSIPGEVLNLFQHLRSLRCRTSFM